MKEGYSSRNRVTAEMKVEYGIFNKWCLKQLAANL